MLFAVFLKMAAHSSVLVSTTLDKAVWESLNIVLDSNPLTFVLSIANNIQMITKTNLLCFFFCLVYMIALLPYIGFGKKCSPMQTPRSEMKSLYDCIENDLI